MLVDVRMSHDPLLALIGAINGNGFAPRRLEQGVYERGDFGSSNCLYGFDYYPDFGDRSPYGVCDDHSQILNQYPELKDEGREFVVMITPVLRGNQPRDGGWRWHKWGEYIGTKTPTCEYLHDEPEIEKVYCFHIYERAR